MCLSEIEMDHWVGPGAMKKGAIATESNYLHTFNAAVLLSALSSEEASPTPL